ncbi:hypothetical protein HDV03_000836 [Kappamyces sp. JEL0829]|nr:hypothetical protein HDV03_000836 [Kappamyces sp. JEL0829]
MLALVLGALSLLPSALGAGSIRLNAAAASSLGSPDCPSVPDQLSNYGHLAGAPPVDGVVPCGRTYTLLFNGKSTVVTIAWHAENPNGNSQFYAEIFPDAYTELTGEAVVDGVYWQHGQFDAEYTDGGNLYIAPAPVTQPTQAAATGAETTQATLVPTTTLSEAVITSYQPTTTEIQTTVSITSTASADQSPTPAAVATPSAVFGSNPYTAIGSVFSPIPADLASSAATAVPSTLFFYFLIGALL